MKDVKNVSSMLMNTDAAMPASSVGEQRVFRAKRVAARIAIDFADRVTALQHTRP